MSSRGCYVYWIRGSTHSEVLTEGYVGISVDPYKRFVEHKNSKAKYYNKDFKQNLGEGLCTLELLFYGSVRECFDLENELRPFSNIGWNISPGGLGGLNLSHGLAGHPVYKLYTYYKGLSKYGKFLHKDWLGPAGVLKFIEFYDSKPEGTKLTFTSKVMSQETAEFKTTKDINKEILSSRVLSGIVNPVSTLGDIFDIRPNTISTRISRGYSLEEACGLVKRHSRMVVVNGVEFKYNGKLSDNQIETLERMYISGESQVSIGKVLNMNSSNIGRLLRRFNLAE